MIGPEDRVLVGVSGGADSVCLLLVLEELGYEVAAAHLNHGLRGAAADEDEKFVQALARNLEVQFFAARQTVRGRGNLEQAARKARRTFFEETARAHGFTEIALAHTRDDRVETFLMNLLRGSGMDGLTSMAPVVGNTIRPLIETRRSAAESYLRQRGQSWRIDETNFDQKFARNRLRHDVIPRIASEFNTNLADTLSRTIRVLEDEDRWVRHLADDWLIRHSTREPDGLIMDARILQEEPAGLVRRVVRTALRREGSTLQDVTFDHVEAVRSLLGPSKSGRTVEVPGGAVVVREFDRLVVRKPVPPADDYEYELKIPGQVQIPELRKVFRAEVVEQVSMTDTQRVLVDAESLGPCVRIRNWKPGDYYRPMGLPAGKVKKLFQRARIPRNRRKGWPVLVSDLSIVWVTSFPISRDFAPGECSQKAVAFEVFPG